MMYPLLTVFSDSPQGDVQPPEIHRSIAKVSGYFTHVVQNTLLCDYTTVPSEEFETGEIMNDYFQTWLPELKVNWVNDVCYVDTVFCSALSG